MPEGFYEDISLCHKCWFSEKVQSWRTEKQETDPAYKYYSDNITAGFKVLCTNCRHETHRHPKFIGHSPTWELCCTECAEVNYEGISPYQYDLTEWHKLYDDFLKGGLDLDHEWNHLQSMEQSLGLPVLPCK